MYQGTFVGPDEHYSDEQAIRLAINPRDFSVFQDRVGVNIMLT